MRWRKQEKTIIDKTTEHPHRSVWLSTVKSFSSNSTSVDHSWWGSWQRTPHQLLAWHARQAWLKKLPHLRHRRPPSA